MKTPVIIGTATLYNSDCLEAMKAMPDNAFDLAIVDPPYGIGEDGASNHSRNKLAAATKYTPKQWDKEPPSVEYFKQLQRVSKNQIIWGANHFISRIPNNSPCWIVWDKLNGENDFADCELAYTSFKTAVRRFSFRWAGMLQGDMKDKEQRIHPTQKPAALYKYILNTYAKPGSTILDTHHGSGSNAIACIDMGYSITAYEIDAEYFKASVERIQRSQQQCKLFDTGATWQQAEKVKGELTGSLFA